jgi:hypothetical protein
MGADVPVILASGYDQDTVMAGDHPELPQAFLNKPYSMAALKDVLLKDTDSIQNLPVRDTGMYHLKIVGRRNY